MSDKRIHSQDSSEDELTKRSRLDTAVHSQGGEVELSQISTVTAQIDAPDIGSPSQPTALPSAHSGSANIFGNVGEVIPTSPYDVPRTPEQRRSGLSVMSISPQSRIRGRSINLGTIQWSQFIDEDAILVDKTLAIIDVMAPKGGRVIAGVYPRRMGKSTFLATLASFLGVLGVKPRAQREVVFKQCAVYDTDYLFFEEHFGRYHVLKLDFKTHSPTTPEDALELLRHAVVDASKQYIRLLRLNMDSNNNVLNSEIRLDQRMVRTYQWDIERLLNDYDHINRPRGSPINAADVNAILPDLMELLFLLLGNNSVVLVDEYDAPFMGMLRTESLAPATRQHIQDVYANFLSALLKGNEYLYKGVLVGVFDIRHTGLGSGLNNVEVYLAHSGMAGVPGQRNPFEKAFGFTAQDAWSLINDYVDNQWPHRANYPNTAGFKRDLFRGCFEHFDGYRIGKVHNIFNPHTLLQFIRSLDDVTSPDTVSFEGRG